MPATPPHGLSPEETERYNRHLVMPEIGVEGQLRLRAARVVLIGTGGLGAPAGLYLSAAGVGTLGLVDFDAVDPGNLQRQVAFGTRDVGRPKVEAARERLSNLNPHVDIVTHDVRLASTNAIEILGGYDVVIDGSDNFATRYLVNDACVRLGKPNVYGSIFRFEGQTTVFGMPHGPCYRCLYPDPPPRGAVPNCAEAGVLGVLPGIIGTIQAAEAIKLILGKRETLAGRLLLFDCLQMRFREVEVPKNPRCPTCGDSAGVIDLVDYEEFCGEGTSAVAVPEMTPRELKARLDAGDDTFVLDVREPHESRICHLEGHLIPLREIAGRLGELDPARDIVVYCRSGVRSATAVDFLCKAGFRNVWNLRGGILAWSDEVDPSMPRY
ncbi:MAG: molybdopterin-synthase adenylyltransferase MoeB [Candidatus Krumholzibacteriia bacterium]